jgi:hypothetical protein
MRRKLICLLVLLSGLALVGPSATAQDTSTKGAISGSVADSTGAIVPGATVTISGPIGDRVAISDSKGNYTVSNLIPGQYTVKASLTGFKTASVGNVTVYVGKDVSVKLTLSTGDITETIEVLGGAVDIDTSKTAIGANINAQVFENLPVQRRVDNLFYLAPGVTESQAGGRANPSISGGSALDNLYVADGVNITDSSFGGLGVFSRSYGTLGVGINSSYIQEVQVKTGGFEPQYGQSQGGIVNIITKSGGREFRGSVYGYMQPGGLEATRKQPDDTLVNKVGEVRHEQNFDVGFDLGGPLVKDKLFFYGNFNPSELTQTTAAARNSGLAKVGEFDRKYTTYNYAAKLDWNLAPNHQLNFSVFGDPSHSNKAIQGSPINSDNLTNASKLDYGTRNVAMRYNGALSNTWSLTITGSAGKNHFDETGFDNYNGIIDRTQPSRGNFNAIGLGFIEPTNGNTYRGTIDTTKQFSLAGSHSFAIGYQYQRGEYSGTRDRTGPHYEVPATNVNGSFTPNPAYVGQPLNATWSLRLASPTCTLCALVDRGGVLVPIYLRQDRGEFGQPVFDTFNNYNAYYAQDTWKMGKKVTLLLGLRGEQERIEGNPGSTGKRVAYSFTGQWSPRVGITIDPMGEGKTKLYYNFGRFQEYIPLDMAERSLSSEKDFTGGRYAPEYTIDGQGRRIAVINQFGTVNPVVDSQHLLNGGSVPGGPGGGPSFAAQDPTNPILPGTKLGFAQEHLVGFEQQLPGNLVFSARYLNRQLKRIVEDAGLNPPEGTSFFSGVTYFIGNVSSKLDAGTNIIEHTYAPGAPLPAGCDPSLDAGLFTPPGGGAPKGACFEAKGANGKPAASPGADGLPDGFPDVQHKYQAVELELNKRFSHGWQLLANWRIAKVEGNFEGHFRNDNGQTDPAISSLFDFTAGQLGLLGDQFAVGPLNTDRKHVANLYGSYAFKGGESLNIGGGLHLETGVPISQFYAHPIYLNAGEIPLGGRGVLGRSDTQTRVDVHMDYPFKFSKRSKLVVSADFFNLFNSQPVRRTNQFVESTAGQLNPDFTQPGYAKGFGPRGVTSAFYPPFSMRFGVKVDF